MPKLNTQNCSLYFFNACEKIHLFLLDIKKNVHKRKLVPFLLPNSAVHADWLGRVEPAGKADGTRVQNGERGGDGAVQSAEAAAAAGGTKDRRPGYCRRRHVPQRDFADLGAGPQVTD